MFHGRVAGLGYSRAMPPSRLLAVAIVLLACACTPRNPAAPASADAAPASAPTPPPAALADHLLQAALLAAEAGQFQAERFPGIVTHPAYGWVEYAVMRGDWAQVSRADAQAFASRYAGQAVADAFRDGWLAELARRRDWPAFRAAWSPAVESTALRCAELSARAATGALDAQWNADAQALWRNAGTSLPAACDAPLLRLAERGGLPPALRWERLERAAAANQPGVMRAAAQGLPAAEYVLAMDYAAYLAAPHARATQWPATSRSREIASYGLTRLAKSNPDAAETLLPRVSSALGMDQDQRGRVLYEIALQTVASYKPASVRRLAAVPAAAYDERLHEWRAREAIARSDWRAALAAVEAMDTPQREDSRWNYFRARLLDATGHPLQARAFYRQAALKAEFHGFLAADRLQQPYALCPWQPAVSPQAEAAAAQEPGLLRALALWRIGRRGWAEREWQHAMRRYAPAQRHLAVAEAQRHGWFDRGVFGLVNVQGQRHADELNLYHLRFPLHHHDAIRREAQRNGLDPAWIAAEIRAESVFDPNARSSADARGLMQVLPATGAAVAKATGHPWSGGDSLFDPDTNIALGTAYLRQLMDRYGNRPYRVIAGYNAGPAPLNRWISQRPDMDADFWIETISYRETREYVARVLAFSVIYDWRLNGDALRLTDRLRGETRGPRKRFACPAGAPAAAPDTPDAPAKPPPA